MEELKLKEIKKKLDNLNTAFCDGEKNLLNFIDVLSLSLSDTVTVDELLFTIQLLIKDIENGKCGFHNSPSIEEKFKTLTNKLKYRDNLSAVLSFIPRIINQISDTQFFLEFSNKYKKAVLCQFDIEEQTDEYGYIEVDEDVIDISNKDKAEVLARLYNNSQPLAHGVAHYNPTPMTVEVARQILEETTHFDYLAGRPLKINLEENIISVLAYNSNNGKKQAQMLISSCRNINDIGKDKLKKMSDEFNEQIKKEIEKEIEKKHKERQKEQVTTRTQRRNNGLEYLRTDESNLQPMRRLIEESGENISEDTLSFIKNVENEAFPNEMKLMQNINSIEELENIYDYYLSELTITRNNDWYIIYGEDEDSVEIVDIASLSTRDSRASQEMHNYITSVINQKAHNGNKPVTLDAKEDTSYRMIQRMVNNGEYEILEDTTNTWEDNDEIVMHSLILKPIIERIMENIQ